MCGLWCSFRSPGHEEKSLRPEQFCSPKGRHKFTRKVDAAGVKAMLRRNVARLRKEHGKATKLPITQENGIAVSARLGAF